MYEVPRDTLLLSQWYRLHVRSMTIWLNLLLQLTWQVHHQVEILHMTDDSAHWSRPWALFWPLINCPFGWCV